VVGFDIFATHMLFIYNLSIFIAGLLLKPASLFNRKIKLFVDGRRDVKSLLRTKISPNKRVVWVHCASLGEFEQGRPLIDQIKKEFPDHFMLVTFFSPSGYEIRKNYASADLVTYLPLDSKTNASSFIDTCKPELAIFVKYEFWFHYAAELKKRNIPLLSVSSIFRDNQIFFKPWGTLSRKTLRNFTHFFVQNQSSQQLLNTIGIHSVTRTGDTRFDRVADIVRNAEEISIAKNFKGGQKLLVVGSCWEEDLEVLLPLINEDKLKFIIAPHEISEDTLSMMEKSIQVKTIRFSQAQGKNLDTYSVLLIDNVGMLSRLYRYGEFAFIGGAFGKGLHNILEAACYGIPIFFGNKNYQKFQEAVDLINLGGAFEVADFSDFKAKYEMLNVPESFLLACEVTKQYVQDNLGATEKIMQFCRPYLQPNQS